jgi:membrane-bound metal-dependent hydrolase YbcI (DUF457 family)
MWPWSHLAFGYLLYSPTSRALTDGRISGRAVVVLAIATQVPDLVDKPLAWLLSVFPSGYAIAHSVFVAVPVGVAVLAVAYRRARPDLGLAFTVGYWSHLLGDVLLAVALQKAYTVSRVLWPVVVLPGSHTSLGTIEQVEYYFVQFVALLRSSGNPAIYLAYFGPLVAAGVLWLADGAPGVRELHDWALDVQ